MGTFSSDLVVCARPNPHGFGGDRSPTMRLPVKVHRTMRQDPPWHDQWSISMDEASLLQLSAELLALPDPLPPRLRQIRRLVEQAITSGHAEWEHGSHPATLAED